MAGISTIEWTDATWTPIRARHLATGKVGWHCEHASPGCANCYSETFNEVRLGTGLPFKPGHRGDVEHFLDEDMLLAPLRWRKPRRIFVCSMTDLFGDWVTDAWLDRVFAAMALCPQHTFQVLTKRAGRMRAYLSMARAHPVGLEAMDVTLHEMARNPRSDIGRGCILQGDICHLKVWPLPNVWLGVSAEDQRRADERVPDLLLTPAAVRFLSAEPLLGDLQLRRLRIKRGIQLDALTGAFSAFTSSLGGFASAQDQIDALPRLPPRLPGLDWVIVGGESGAGARPMHPAWARSLRDQSAAAGVPFHFKQWGAWKDGSDFASDAMAVTDDGRVVDPTPDALHAADRVASIRGQTMMRRVGKKAAGRLLDGVEHNGMPEVAHG